MAQIHIEQDLCNHCGACVTVCPDHLFQRVEDGVAVLNGEDCLRCWHCVSACPSGAVRSKNIPWEEFNQIDPANLPSEQSLILAFRERRSSRVFSDRPVPRELIERLVDSARWAPSGHNTQDVDWIAIDDRQKIQALGDEVIGVYDRYADLLGRPFMRILGPLLIGAQDYRDSLETRPLFTGLAAAHAGGEDPIFRHAPVVLIGHSPTDTVSLARDNAIYQAYNIMLLAQRLKLGTCQLGYMIVALELSTLGLNRLLLHRLNLPAGRSAQVALAVGFSRVHFRRTVPRRKPTLAWNQSL